jgi:hypothetical protein
MGRHKVPRDCVGYRRQRCEWLKIEALNLQGLDFHATRIHSRDREYENGVPSVLNGTSRLPREALSKLSLNENVLTVLES